MPKRSCPFGESNRPQLKNRIGLKQVNMGVMMEERMKHVYGQYTAFTVEFFLLLTLYHSDLILVNLRTVTTSCLELV